MRKKNPVQFLESANQMIIFQVLSKPLVWSANVWDTFLGLTLKVTTVVVAAYAASLVSMLATCHVLNQVG